MMLQPSVALLFPGGGSQFPGMGEKLCRRHPSVVHIFEEVEDVLKENVRDWCFTGAGLNEMRKSLISVFVVGLANYKAFAEESSCEARFFAGHSLGELTALACANALSVMDAALLVSERGRLLQGAASGRAGMMAVNKMESHHVEQACENINANGGQVYVSVYNSPLQSVVSGTSGSISELKNYLEQQHGECTHLNIQTASHCPILLNESLLFKESLRKVKFNRPAVQVISNLTGEPYAENSDFANILSMHLTSPVQWMRSMTYLFKNGVSVVVDMGPQSIVGRLTEFINDSIEVYSFVDDAAEQQFAAAFPTKADRAIDLVKLCLVFSVSTPSLSSKSLVHASANYEKLKEMLDLARTTRITKVQLKSCIQVARDILHEKSVPNEDVEMFNSALSLHNIEA